MTISVQHLTKRFGSFTALDDISLTIPEGKLTALLGPSGSGKTTLLRCIAGLERANGGTITIDGRVSEATSPAERGVGFVFQHYALFRHMTVAENIAFGLEVRPKATRPSKEAISAKVRQLLALVQLDWAADRLPHQLSGGQRQRIALARALAVEPKYLLLDEPFGALDAQVRKELRRWLRRLHDEVHITTILVTHDQEEALEVADQVVVFNGGKVEQVGSPEAVYHAPASPFVHQFLGTVNLLSGEGLHTYVRPHDLTISPVPAADHPLTATVTGINAAGPVVRIDLRHGDTHLEALVSHADHAQRPVTVGQEVHVGFHRSAVYQTAPSGATP